jgi:lipid II:glycine glycyltransferase (peptidoglycan interpeptide bridge formation enzyme)
VFRFADGDAIAQVIELPLPFGKKYWYCPKGPLVGITNYELRITNFIEGLVGRAKQAGAVFLRIEPESEIRNPKSAIRKSGSTQPKCTTIVDLAKSEDELMKAMHEKTRYNIRLAERHGVTVERYIHSKVVFDELYDLFNTTAGRDKFHLHPKTYYAKQLAAFAESDPVVPGAHTPHVITFVARCEGKLLVAAIVMFDGDTATYLHGASASEMRNVMAPHALHWAIMQRVKERGYQYYDFWGISTGDEPSWEGITRFKIGFGGETVCAPGTFDLIVNGFWYSIYALAKKFI